MIMRALAIGAVAGALVVGGTAAAHAVTTSTKLSNGTLSFTAVDGSAVNGDSSVFFASTAYKKTGGSTVSVRLEMITKDGRFGSGDAYKSVSAGQNVITQWGGISKSYYASDCKATGSMWATGSVYYTPTVHFC
ncbi:hypothetical protein [Streptomyces nojiriensis]|uniref:hypothetical protein n=1 Tax=Streptomyces nojiriensis TaxID=66374 RepID=UPI00366334C2